jgi:hypothetical protein
MVRGISAILASGLTVLWLVGLGRHATPWLSWLDGLGALCGFAIALGASDIPTRNRAAGPIALGMGLVVLWIIGLATHSNFGLTWWTLFFACAFLLVGIVARFSKRQPAPRTPRPA